MGSSTNRTIIPIVLVVCAVVCIQAQTTTQKVANASISGKVTIKGKPAAGVLVIAKDARDGSSSMIGSQRAWTDQTGSYRFTNLTAGTYGIFPVAPALTATNEADSVIVSEGEEVQDVNIQLAPGGVITGKITNSEGEPVVGQSVSVHPVQPPLRSRYGHIVTPQYYSDNQTDDRGVYRLFGLPAGKYKVSVGESDYGRKMTREYFKQTFYPSVTDTAKATIIEVTEGSVASGIDIVMSRRETTFTVAGRVVDETGRPVPNMQFGMGQTIQHDKNSSSSSYGTAGNLNANGEFRLENLTPGRYTIYVSPDTDVPASSVTFDVVDRNLDDLLITTTKGASLSGVVVLDGNENAPAIFSSLRICASGRTTEAAYGNSAASGVAPDGTFTIRGAQSGAARLWVCSGFDMRQQFEIVRVEQNGVPQAETINVKAGEHVSGLRVTIKFRKLTGTIRGQVKFENDEVPATLSQLWLNVWPLDDNLQPKSQSSIPSPELDARGRFSAERLPAGVYQLRVYVYTTDRTSGQTKQFVEKIQQVTVTEDTVTEVTVIIKPPPNPK